MLHTLSFSVDFSSFSFAGSDQLPPPGREGRGDHADTADGGLGQPSVF